MVLRRIGLALLRLALEAAARPTPLGLDLRGLLALADATEVYSRARAQMFEGAWEETMGGLSDEALVNPLVAGFHEYFAWAYEDNLNAARAGYEALGNNLDPRAAKVVLDEVAPWLLGYRDPVRERLEARKAAD